MEKHDKWYSTRLLNRIREQHIGICFSLIRKSYQSKFKTGGTIKEVARGIRVSPSALSTFEKGLDDHIKDLPSIVKRLSEYLKIDPEDFPVIARALTKKSSRKKKKSKETGDSTVVKSLKRLNITIKNGIEEPLQVRIRRSSSCEIVIELFDTEKKRSGALWVAPAVVKFHNSTDVHMPEVKKVLR